MGKQKIDLKKRRQYFSRYQKEQESYARREQHLEYGKRSVPEVLKHGGNRLLEEYGIQTQTPNKIWTRIDGL